jgi:hypothetical protein
MATRSMSRGQSKRLSDVLHKFGFHSNGWPPTILASRPDDSHVVTFAQDTGPCNRGIHCEGVSETLRNGAQNPCIALGRRWTHRQSGRSAVRAYTRRTLLVTEALHDGAAADVARVVDTLTTALRAASATVEPVATVE